VFPDTFDDQVRKVAKQDNSKNEQRIQGGFSFTGKIAGSHLILNYRLAN
jgi:hypothetical protein